MGASLGLDTTVREYTLHAVPCISSGATEQGSPAVSVFQALLGHIFSRDVIVPLYSTQQWPVQP